MNTCNFVDNLDFELHLDYQLYPHPNHTKYGMGNIFLCHSVRLSVRSSVSPPVIL